VPDNWGGFRLAALKEGVCLYAHCYLEHGSKWGRALLDLALKENNLVGVTQDNFSAAQKVEEMDRALLAQCIDHICLDRRWAKLVKQVGVWPNKTAGGEYLSDHSGVFVDLGQMNKRA
jgi:hypothetical protein